MKRFIENIGFLSPSRSSRSLEKKESKIPISSNRMASIFFVHRTDNGEFVFRLKGIEPRADVAKHCRYLLSDIKIMSIEKDDGELVPKFSYQVINESEFDITTDLVSELLELMRRAGIIDEASIKEVMADMLDSGMRASSGNLSTPLLCK